MPAEFLEMLDEKEPGFPVWPENMRIVDAFLSVTSQLRPLSLAGGGLHWLGLDYAGARAGLRQAGFRLLPHQWSYVRVMERAAVAALNGVRG